MNTRTKLVALELLAGISGWGWIIAGGFAVYYLITAIGFGGAWSSFFLAVAISAGCKWLARGFNAHKGRVAYVAEQAGRSVSTEEANAEWFRANGYGELSLANEGRGSSANVLTEYGALMEEIAGALAVDVKRLPVPKEQLKASLLDEIANAKDERAKEVYKAAFLGLSSFFEGVGEDVMPYLSNPDNAAKASSDPGHLADILEKEQRWQERGTAEMEALMGELKAAGY